MKPTLVLLTGPQGSGNHLFSKILSNHPSVYGWRMKEYWEGHHHEPFAKYWDDPSLLREFNWTQSKYYFTSISCPYFRYQSPQIPLYKQFITKVQKFCNVKIAIIGRDQNILKKQQIRVRGSHTLKHFLNNIDTLMKYNPIFISSELYQLYGKEYLTYLSKVLDFPILYQGKTEDSNAKYIHNIDHYWLDDEVKKACDES